MNSNLPDDLLSRMNNYPDADWEGTIRRAIERKLALLEQLEADKDINEWAVSVVRKGRRKM